MHRIARVAHSTNTETADVQGSSSQLQHLPVSSPRPLICSSLPASVTLVSETWRRCSRQAIARAGIAKTRCSLSPLAVSDKLSRLGMWESWLNTSLDRPPFISRRVRWPSWGPYGSGCKGASLSSFKTCSRVSFASASATSADDCCQGPEESCMANLGKMHRMKPQRLSRPAAGLKAGEWHLQ